jgi:hypothetical protein
MESIEYFFLQECGAFIDVLFSGAPFQLQETSRHDYDVQLFIHGNKSTPVGNKNNMVSFWCNKFLQSSDSYIIKSRRGKDLISSFYNDMPPAALPGAYTTAGAPGLLKKFDQNF